jgi:type IV secretion system protein VirB1
VIDFNTLVQQCAPHVHPTTMTAVVRTESHFNPYAIGVVGGHLVRQPRNLAEAVATVRALDARGINFSVGLGQVNKSNFAKFGLTYETAFDLCKNLSAGGQILSGCYQRAADQMGAGGQALKAAFSCYYSGNFTAGFTHDFNGTSYVQRVAANALPVDAVPAIAAVMDTVQAVKNASGAGKAERAGAASASHASDLPASAPTDAHDPAAQKEGGWDAFGDFTK